MTLIVSDNRLATAQFVYTTSTVRTTISTVIPADDTIPQITEGVQVMTLSITPKNANSTLIIEAKGYLGQQGSTGQPLFTMALFRDSTANALAAATQTFDAVASAGSWLLPLQIYHVVAAGSTATTTFKIRAGSSMSGNCYFNGTTASRMLGGVLNSGIWITEILP